ncbi:hypothetical protein [Sneathiella glossodoripedis]|uniref:hypothetical protein n=1 Tax=Sneathiella glossodoripedis TaxID=418853 RepID=UPI00047085F5|nr:hypothetical protein [Sneathiella glossodoripedis]
MLGNYQHVPNARIANKSTTIVFVALYFLLLAFFIYLNSISEPAEERIRSVIGSIDVAFKGEEKTQQEHADTHYKQDKLGNAVFHAQLKQVYEAAIPLIKSEESKEGDSLRFRIPVSQLFAEKSTDIRAARQDLLDETARILIKRSSVVPTDMEISLRTSADLPKSDELGGNLDIKRLNTLVESFAAQGVPARNLFVGLSGNAENEVVFQFYVRDNFNHQFQREADK